MSEVDLDHTSFAVHDARAWAGRFRRELGATPIAGESVGEFRYLLMHVGGSTSGGRLELLEPSGPGFLDRFLARHGEAAHHITFMVSDLVAVIAGVRSLGLEVQGEDLTHTPWREAFVVPDEVHGVVVQLAQTDRAFPLPADLMASRKRSVEDFPSNRGAKDPHWWSEVWDDDPGDPAVVVSTVLHSTDLALSRSLFHEVLGGSMDHLDDGLRFSWPRSSLVVREALTPGVSAVVVTGGPPEGIDIGPARIGGGARG